MPRLYVATNGLSVWSSTDLGETLVRTGTGRGMYSGSQVWALAPRGGTTGELLAGTNTGITRPQYLALRVLALRGPALSPAALQDYLASQPQVGLDRAQVAELFRGLETRGLVTGSAPDSPGSIQLTTEGAALNARLADAVAALTERLYADLDPDDLATAHRVLVEITQRANRLRDEP